MNHHAGYIKNRNGIEYNIANIPENVVLYQDWSDEIEPSVNALQCLSEEIIHTLKEDYSSINIVNSYSSFFEITPTKGMPPVQLKEPYTIRAFYNCKHKGLVHIKHVNTQKKYTFTVDKNMLLVLHDPKHEYIVGCPYSPMEEQNRTVFSFAFST